VKKFDVEASYQHFKEANGGLGPNLAHIARDCNVSPNYVKEIESEICNHGRVFHPEEKKDWSGARHNTQELSGPDWSHK
jgi:hypothetical protein